MKRPSYRFAVQWIAGNDNSSTLDLQAIEQSVTVALAADMFGKSEEAVAIDVQRAREVLFARQRAERAELASSQSLTSKEVT